MYAVQNTTSALTNNQFRQIYEKARKKSQISYENGALLCGRGLELSGRGGSLSPDHFTHP